MDCAPTLGAQLRFDSHGGLQLRPAGRRHPRILSDAQVSGKLCQPLSYTQDVPQSGAGHLARLRARLDTCRRLEGHTMPASPTTPNRPPAAEPADHWLELANQARDPHTALDYAQRAIDAQPDDPRVQASIQHGVLGHLGQDAFVGYM